MIYLLYAPAALYLLWLLYVLTMGFRRAWPQLSTVAKAFALPVVLAAVVVDVAINVLSSVVFLDLPREWTLSYRFKRYGKLPYTHWRWRVAYWVCTHMLDPFDPDGDHC